VPGIIVALFATRATVLLGALTDACGFFVSFHRHSGYGSIAVGNILPERQFVPAVLRELAILVVIGTAVVALGTWLRRRLTCVGADHDG
jgi:hypothetical protein